MVQVQNHDELQEIIDAFSKPGVMPSEVRPAILTLARRLKALEEKQQSKRTTRS
jgi:hypothetical protein